MGENSKIEWTDHSFNPWIGCSKVSPGCAHCYAEAINTRMKWAEWKAGGKRFRNSERYRRRPYQWNLRAAVKRERVFCASMADWLDPDTPPEWRTDLIDLISKTPNLDWLLLTKRIERFFDFEIELPKNVWLGVTAENQETWNQRLPVLLSIPATVHFVSAEPLLGQIKMGEFRPDWLIAGGESGPGARPMESAWIKNLRDECDARTVFFFKQWGGKNKKLAGRELDGRTYSAIPKPKN